MRLLLIIISLLFSGFCVEAQTAKPIRWSFSLSKNEVKQGDAVEIIMKAEINTDWYLYSSDFDAELGPTVTAIVFEGNPGFKVIGTLRPVGAKEKYDSLWGGKIRYFTKHAEYRQKVKILKTNPVVKGTLVYQVCSDKEGKCIPYEEVIFFDKLKVVAMEVPQETKESLVIKETIENKEEVKTPVSSQDKLSTLESEKEKLIQKDAKGNDIAVKQLNTFSQKYGGDK